MRRLLGLLALLPSLALGATGDTLIIFTPQNNEPPSTNYCTLDTRNSHLVLDCDASTSESMVFRAAMPRNYAGGGVTVYLHYAMTSATSGDVVFDVSWERVSDSQQDIDSDGFATANTVTATVPGTSGHVDITSINFSNGAQMDSVAVGEGFRLKVTRDVSDAADTAAGDLEFWAAEVKEQ